MNCDLNRTKAIRRAFLLPNQPVNQHNRSQNHFLQIVFEIEKTILIPPVRTYFKAALTHYFIFLHEHIWCTLTADKSREKKLFDSFHIWYFSAVICFAGSFILSFFLVLHIPLNGSASDASRENEEDRIMFGFLHFANKYKDQVWIETNE